MMPRVSIIIPVFNGENYIKDAIDSAIAQTYNNLEIIIVDDGSVDRTAEICQSYGNKIRYFYKENGGVASAVNLGIQKMEGDYFSWLSHDDIYHSDKIEKQMKAVLASDDKTVIVHGNYNIRNDLRQSITYVKNERTFGVERMCKSVFPILLIALHGCVPLVHKRHFERVGVFNESLLLTQDYDFFFRLMRDQKSIFIEEPLVDVRIHAYSGRNISSDFEQECALQYLYFAEQLTLCEIREMFGNENIFYFRTAAMMASRGLSEKAFLYLDKVNCANSKVYNFHSIMKTVVKIQWKRIAIFGIGFQGKMLFYELRGRGMQVECFIDNNTDNYGRIWHNISCISLMQVLNEEKDTLIIVSPEDSDAIVMQLKESGLNEVVTKKQLERLFLEYPPFCIEVIKNEMGK